MSDKICSHRHLSQKYYAFMFAESKYGHMSNFKTVFLNYKEVTQVTEWSIMLKQSFTPKYFYW